MGDKRMNANGVALALAFYLDCDNVAIKNMCRIYCELFKTTHCCFGISQILVNILQVSRGAS